MPTYFAPSTWATGTIVTSTFLDQQIFENMKYVGTTHRHSTGTAGEGQGYIGPITYLDAKGAAVPAAPTNATVARVFATATALGWQSSASSTFYFANTLHEHSITNVATATADASTRANAAVGALNLAITTSPTGTMSTAITIGGSGSRAVNIVAGGFLTAFSSGTDDGRAQINIDGVLQTEVTKQISGVGGTSWGTEITHSPLLTNVASGSVTYSYTARANVGNQRLYGGFVSVREIKM